MRSCQFSTTTIRHGRVIPGAAAEVAFGLAGALLFCLCSPGLVYAYEDQLTIGVGTGYAHSISDTEPASGARLEISGSTGLNLAWTARARLSYGFHPAADALHVGMAAVELLYLIDVVEFVPHFGAGASVLGSARDDVWRAYPAVHGVLGVDYLMSRELTLELDLSAHARVTALDTDPLYLTATVSLVWMLER